MRHVVNGLMYILSTGCQRRAIPKDLPPKSTVYGSFDLWTYDGTINRLHHALYVKYREAAGREAAPRLKRTGQIEKGARASMRLAQKAEDMAASRATHHSVNTLRQRAPSRYDYAVSLDAPPLSCGSSCGESGPRSYPPTRWKSLPPSYPGIKHLALSLRSVRSGSLSAK
jgi:transposase